MNTNRSGSLLALTIAGVLWGATVPLTKIALDGWGPMWLTSVRFVLAAVPLLLLTGRNELRRALTPRVLLWGAAGYGLVIVLQGMGVARTSVAHASLILGLTPLLAAAAAALMGSGTAGRRAWTGFAVAFTGIALIATAGGGPSSIPGDALVAISMVLTTVFLFAQPALLTGRSPLAVTAVQFAAAGLITAPIALLTEGPPVPAMRTGPLIATAALVIAGTLLPYALFAFAQSRVAPDLAGAFLNIEPLVGFSIGVLAFHDPFGPLQITGGLAVLTGLALSALPHEPQPADRPVLPLTLSEFTQNSARPRSGSSHRA